MMLLSYCGNMLPSFLRPPSAHRTGHKVQPVRTVYFGIPNYLQGVRDSN